MRALALLCVLAGCHKKAPPGDVGQFALSFVEAARGGGIPADAVDEAMIVRLHRAQKLQMAAQGKAPREILDKIWHDESETHGSPAERSARQRERAQVALKRTLKGECHAELDDRGAQLRVGALTQPPADASDEVQNGLGQLKHDLQNSRVVRVACGEGSLGVLVLDMRVVDLFQIGTGPKIDVKPGQ